MGRYALHSRTEFLFHFVPQNNSHESLNLTSRIYPALSICGIFCVNLEVYAPSGLDAEQNGSVLPTFRDNLSIQSSRVKQSLYIEQISCPETWVRNYLSTLRKIPKCVNLVSYSTTYDKCSERMPPVDIGLKELMPHISIRFVLYISNRGVAFFTPSGTDLIFTTVAT